MEFFRSRGRLAFLLLSSDFFFEGEYSIVDTDEASSESSIELFSEPSEDGAGTGKISPTMSYSASSSMSVILTQPSKTAFDLLSVGVVEIKSDFLLIHSFRALSIFFACLFFQFNLLALPRNFERGVDFKELSTDMAFVSAFSLSCGDFDCKIIEVRGVNDCDSTFAEGVDSDLVKAALGRSRFNNS